ncbi:unnamed protein product [Nippostrongylus brasiliensis]|uniref:HTH_11 domain-containing protein n=1 Tax=Nippostrongylus brasiliensis TaxID=27835 RepID=A0A0N4XNH9_NIPBR|nr:unnamed protein product [Nippostrongylus brasiliensis]
MTNVKCLRTAMKKLHIEGVPASETATKLSISKRTVYSNLKRLEETGTMGKIRSAEDRYCFGDCQKG